MTTITINTYDPEARFNMDKDEASLSLSSLKRKPQTQGLMFSTTVATMSMKKVSALLKNALRIINQL